MQNPRSADHPIDIRFLERWSPRAFDGNPITRDELLTVLEAGRWAPSAFNAQPWHYVFAHRDTAAWSTLFGLLVEANQAWVKSSSALVFVLSEKAMPPGRDGVAKPSRTHSFDAGASWAMMALQAAKMGLAAHGMTGFDAARAPAALAVPDTFAIDMVFAVGHPADASVLPTDLAAKEMPNGRRPLQDSVSEGAFSRRSKA